ncbi:MAG TPA: nuclear transport factor 2 family protein [Pseudonocardia sp.]|jgi:ketosteroid isomerase-like protein
MTRTPTLTPTPTSTSTTTATSPSAVEVEIRTLVARRTAALRAGDPDALVGAFAPGAVTFTLAPPLRNVGSSVHDPDGLRRWFGTFDGPVDYEVRELVVNADADLAFCHSLNRMSATPRGATEPFDLWFRSTLGLRRVDGTWRIVHQHDSTPFYMDGSFAAALDLTP